MGRRFFSILAGLAIWFPAIGVSAGPAASQSEDFSDWAVAIVAADWRTSQGAPIQAFENARRDLADAFAGAGFSPGNITALSIAPSEFGGHVSGREALDVIAAHTQSRTGGCLLYFTSHGSPAGVVWGTEGMLSPAHMRQLVDGWCGTRPTVVVVSACFSGVFVPALAAPNRMILTAARRDRSSFGCSEDATYPYFDGCILEALDGASDFMALSMAARACVSRREREENLRPASEPQVHVGAEMQLLLPFMRFSAD